MKQIIRILWIIVAVGVVVLLAMAVLAFVSPALYRWLLDRQAALTILFTVIGGVGGLMIVFLTILERLTTAAPAKTVPEQAQPSQLRQNPEPPPVDNVVKNEPNQGEETQRNAVPEPTSEPARKPDREATDLERPLYNMLISEAFQKRDLDELCFLLGVEWDEIAGDTKTEKARNMIRFFQSHNRLPELADAARKMRPHLG